MYEPLIPPEDALAGCRKLEVSEVGLLLFTEAALYTWDGEQWARHDIEPELAP